MELFCFFLGLDTADVEGRASSSDCFLFIRINSFRLDISSRGERIQNGV